MGLKFNPLLLNGFDFTGSSGGGGSGTVTSVGLSLPGIFTVSGSPVTTSGTLTGALASQSQNLVFASPNGSSGTPTFRSLVASDIPALSYASVSLNNLSSTAVNASIVPSSNNSFELGSSLIAWGTTHTSAVSANSSVLSLTGSGIQVNGLKIQSVGTPTSGTDAATKAYVDSLIVPSANQTLSNLTSPTAINQDMLPGSAGTIKLGSTSSQWTEVNSEQFTNVHGGVLTSRFFSNTGPTPSGLSVDSSIFTFLNKPFGVYTATNASGSGLLTLETGNASSGNSGNINIQTGTASGTRGIVSLNGRYIDANTTQIKNVVDPTLAQDVATKAYVDSSSSSAISALTGDVTATGPGSSAATLATVNSNVGSFGSSTSIPNFTVNAKGLITAAGGNVVIAPAGTLTGTTLASNVVTSSLTSVGTQAATLNMGSNPISNVSNPTNPQDAATKAYVDANTVTGDITQTSFTAADNQVSAADVIGLAFSNASVRSFEAQVSIVRSSTYQVFKFIGIQKASSWEMSQDFVGDDAGLTFSITTAGQIQYTSTSTGSTALLKFRAIVTSV